MLKNYVLDTNVLIQAPYAFSCFEEHHIFLPVAVLEELDNLKNADGETGANARSAIRFLESLRTKGNLHEGVELPTGGILRLEVNHVHMALPEGFRDDKNDNRILKVCKGLQEEQLSVILITKDIVMRIKAQMMGIEAEDFTTEQAPLFESQYSGRMEIYAKEEAFQEFKKKGLQLEDVYQLDEKGNPIAIQPVLNQFILIRSDQSERKTQLGRYDGAKIVKLEYKKESPYGVRPRNVGQYFLQ